MKRLSVVLALSAAILSTPSLATASEASEPAFGTKLADVALVRPITMVGSLVSTVVAVGISPLTWMTGMGGESVDYMIAAPWRFTAGRYPGEFSDYKDGRSLTGKVIQ